ncbi:hypothetical protein ACWGGS_29795 [Streptomyces decoyicus]
MGGLLTGPHEPTAAPLPMPAAVADDEALGRVYAAAAGGAVCGTDAAIRIWCCRTERDTIAGPAPGRRSR